jgi:KDO2-lipid IV(A) lauroyltransferase
MNVRCIRHFFEAIILYALFCIFAILPIKVASAIGGYIAQGIGLLLEKRKRIALINLNIAFPQMSDIEKKAVVSKMWNNLGRIFAEMPYWYMMKQEKMLQLFSLPEVLSQQMQNIIQNQATKLIIISGHYGNWELCNHILPLVSTKCALVYRSLENKYMDCLLKKTRESKGAILVKKDNGGIKNAIKLFYSGYTLGMLVDQRHLKGELIPFFGKDAPTVILPVKLAQQNKTPIVMINIMRIKGVKYKVEFKEISLDNDDPIDIMKNIHHEMEKTIISAPEQWFWIHKRWPQENYNEI